MASTIIKVKLIMHERQSVNSLLRNRVDLLLCAGKSFSEDICKCSTELESLIYTLGLGEIAFSHRYKESNALFKEDREDSGKVPAEGMKVEIPT